MVMVFRLVYVYLVLTYSIFKVFYLGASPLLSLRVENWGEGGGGGGGGGGGANFGALGAFGGSFISRPELVAFA